MTPRLPTLIDYLTLRYTWELAPPPPTAFDRNWWPLSIDHGEVRYQLTPIGQLRSAHGGIHLILPGEFWTPREPDQNRSYRTALDWTHLLDHHIATTSLDPHTSCARVDWCSMVPLPHTLNDGAEASQWTRELAQTLMESAALAVPHRHGYTLQETRDETGITVRILQRGTDLEKARSRAWFWRVYYRPAIWGTWVRIEAECKRIDGDSATAQLDASANTYDAILAHAGLTAIGDPNTATRAMPLLQGNPARREHNANDAWTRGAGHILSHALRHGIELDPLVRLLDRCGRLMFATDAAREPTLKKYLDRQSKRLSAGHSLTVTEPAADERNPVLTLTPLSELIDELDHTNEE